CQLVGGVESQREGDLLSRLARLALAVARPRSIRSPWRHRNRGRPAYGLRIELEQDDVGKPPQQSCVQLQEGALEDRQETTSCMAVSVDHWGHPGVTALSQSHHRRPLTSDASVTASPHFREGSTCAG